MNLTTTHHNKEMKHILSPSSSTLRRLRVVMLVPVLCCAILPAPAQVVNFNDGTDKGAVRMDPVQDALIAIYGAPQPSFGTWSFPNGGYEITAAVPPDPSLGQPRAGSYWTNDIYTYTNFYASVDVRPWGINTNQAVGILGRIQSYSGSGYVYTYTLTYEPYVGDFQLSAFNGNSYDQLSVTNLHLSATNAHRMVFTATDNVLQGLIYEYPDVVNPAATVSYTDSGYTYTGGWCGLLVFSNPNDACDATYDNYLALPEPPTSLSVTNSGNQVWVSWPVGQVNYTLQSNAVLSSASWTSITNGIIQSGGQNIYKTTPSGFTFYRLMTNY